MLLQWDGYVEDLDRRALWRGPGREVTDAALMPFDCRREGLPPASCAWIVPRTPLEAGSHEVRIEGPLKARSGEALPSPTLAFEVRPQEDAMAPVPLGPAQVACLPDETPVEVGCLRITDDTANLRTAATRASLLRLELSDGERAAAVFSSRPVALSLPLTRAGEVTWTADDLAGATTTRTWSVAPENDFPEVALTSVLANPLGSEEAAEYAEVVNRGASTLELTGFRLSGTPAATGSAVLGERWLAPGQRAWLVGPEFDPGAFQALPAGLPLIPVERALRFDQGGTATAVLRDARGRRVAELALPDGAPGRCVEAVDAGRARVGPCPYDEVTPP